MSDHPLEAVFRPRSVALYGISRNMQNRSNQFFLRGMLDQGFHETAPLYLVNPNADEIAGIRCYPSLEDCPDPVDYVISLVPAPAAGGLIEECIAKGVRALHLYTGGFAENLDPERAALEQALIGKARSGGLRVIGPNCMGLYHPAARMAFTSGHPKEAGDVTVVCQSGGNAMDIISGLAQRGARFAKVVSFGNGTDIGAAELLGYAAEDPETRIVLAYIEDTSDGRALYEALRVCARAKPTIVLKGGISSAGARAARSHTASLAGSHEVFVAASRQAGAAVVRSLDEMVDLAVALSTRLREVAGPRAVLVSGGGGFSVLTTDALAGHGIDLPELDGATLARLREVVPSDGNSIDNPIDASYMGDDAEQAMKVVTDAAARDANTDFLVTMLRGSGAPAGASGAPGRTGSDEAQERAIEELAELQESSRKPIAVSARRDTALVAADVLRLAYERGLAVFADPVRAGRAVELLLQWRRDREGLPPLP